MRRSRTVQVYDGDGVEHVTKPRMWRHVVRQAAKNLIGNFDYISHATVVILAEMTADLLVGVDELQRWERCLTDEALHIERRRDEWVKTHNGARNTMGGQLPKVKHMTDLVHALHGLSFILSTVNPDVDP